MRQVTPADSSPALVRIATGGLAAVHAWWGAWAYLAPRHFYDTFPGFGHRWTAGYPPYNEHLVADLGATFLTFAMLLGVGAVTTRRPVRRLALLAVTVFSTLHLAFHLIHHGRLHGPDLPASIASLLLGVLLPVVLLVADRASATAGDRAG